ncbi:MAG: hypothetical protein AAGL11_01330 [Pseudomonadota bacterium]
MSDKAKDYAKIDCDDQPIRKEMEKLGADLVQNNQADDPLESLVSTTRYLGFSCRRICKDGSVNSECHPAPTEPIQIRCYHAKLTETCSHTLRVVGVSREGRLVKDATASVMTQKRVFIRWLFERREDK